MRSYFFSVPFVKWTAFLFYFLSVLFSGRRLSLSQREAAMLLQPPLRCGCCIVYSHRSLSPFIRWSSRRSPQFGSLEAPRRGASCTRLVIEMSCEARGRQPRTTAVSGGTAYPAGRSHPAASSGAGPVTSVRCE